MIAHACALASERAGGALRVLSVQDVRAGKLTIDERSPVWIDLAEPDADDIDWLRRTFAFHPMALEDVTRRHQRPKIDSYGTYHFVVLYAALLRSARGGHRRGSRIETRELQFFWSKSSLVTIHAEPLNEIDELIRRIHDSSVAPIVASDTRAFTVADVAYWLIDAVIDGYFPIVDRVSEWTEDVEEELFSARRGSHTLQSIFSLKKDLFNVRKVLAPTREVISTLARREHSLFSDEFHPYVQDVYDHVSRIIDSLDTYRDLLTTSLDAYLSFVSNEVNQTVKRMTALSAILMVDALVAGIYGMNFVYMPELLWPYGYPFALGLMAAATLVLFLLFRRIRWF